MRRRLRVGGACRSANARQQLAPCWIVVVLQMSTAQALPQGTDVSGSVFSFGDEKLGASSNSDRAGGVPFSTSAAAAAAGLNALVADDERGLMLEKAFAPSDAGSDGSHGCTLL
jgi:hypothetical protein